MIFRLKGRGRVKEGASACILKSVVNHLLKGLRIHSL